MSEASTLLDVASRVVMISGASRGIGRALAERLASEGYRLSLGVRRPGEAAKALGLDPAKSLFSPFEAADPASAERWVAATLERFGAVDALINNAGIFRKVSFDEGEADLDALFAVNVKAPYRLISLTLPHLRNCGHGRIVNIASTDGKRYRDATASIGYVMSKHALVALSHAAKFAGWEHGVRVTALCPGAVETELIAGVPGAAATRLSPGTLADIVSLLLRLPNTASVSELVVNTRLESTL
jgi:NAD(P)-dependent dehydrogenase (short-subunit alcohol dehydrogenase family)